MSDHPAGTRPTDPNSVDDVDRATDRERPAPDAPDASVDAPVASDDESGVETPSADAPAPPAPPMVQGARRRPDSPRRVRNGLRVKLRLAEELPSWPAGGWFERIVATLPTPVRDEGIVYARAGQVVTFGVQLPADDGMPVRVVATVQGRAPRPYEVEVAIPSWPRQRWERVIDAMACEAIYAAKLLGGEVPTAVDELVTGLGDPLLPPTEALRFSCGCADAAPCKHVVAAACLLAERMVESPLMTFTLRGMSGEEVVHRLHEARALQTRGLATAHSASPLSDVASRSFEACLADFWRPGPQIAEVEHSERDEHVPHALLRRLGPSPLQGKFPLVGLLASIYDSIRKGAHEMSGEE